MYTLSVLSVTIILFSYSVKLNPILMSVTCSKLDAVCTEVVLFSFSVMVKQVAVVIGERVFGLS